MMNSTLSITEILYLYIRLKKYLWFSHEKIQLDLSENKNQIIH